MTDTPNVQVALQDDGAYGAWRHGDVAQQATPATPLPSRRFELDENGKAILPIRWLGA